MPTLWRAVMLAGMAVLIAGCGTSAPESALERRLAASTRASTPTSNTTPGVSTGSSRTTATASSPATESHGPTYSDRFTITANNFRFSVSLHAALGEPTISTQGLSPPKVNVIIPVTGSGTITNTTSGYTADSIPGASLYALYPVNAHKECIGYLDSEVEVWAPHQAKLCRVTVATFAVSCAGATSAEEPSPAPTLAPGATAPLTACASNGVGTGATSVGDSPTLGVATATSHSEAQEVMGISRHPAYWVVANSANANECELLGTNTRAPNNVVASVPPGLKGCVGPEE